MVNINHCVFGGNVTRDPELRTTGTGHQVCSFSLAVNNPRKKDETEFIKVETWRKTADVASQYLSKGSSCVVIGRFKTEKYTTKEGVERTISCLVANELILGRRPDSQPQQRYESQQQSQPQNQHSEGSSDDIPF